LLELLREDTQHVPLLFLPLLDYIRDARPDILNAQLVMECRYLTVPVSLHEQLGLAVLTDEDRISYQASATFNLIRRRYELLNELGIGGGVFGARVESPVLLPGSDATAIWPCHLQLAYFAFAGKVNACLELDDLLASKTRRSCEAGLNT